MTGLLRERGAQSIVCIPVDGDDRAGHHGSARARRCDQHTEIMVA
ncbi:MAG: hypothetical protein ACRDPW_08955 [Mycobacteriales bacterium]